MTIEEMKNVVEQCKEDVVFIEINGIKFSNEFEFDFNDNFKILFIRFYVAEIGGVVASIDYNDIKSINGIIVELSTDKVSTSV